MKDLKKIISISKKFYICVFSVLCIFVIFDCIDVIKYNNFLEYDSGIKYLVDKEINKYEFDVQYQFDEYRMNGAKIFADRLCGLAGTYSAYWYTLLGVLLILLLRNYTLTKTKNSVFSDTLSDNKVAWELHDFFATVMCFLGAYLIQTVIMIKTQTKNNMMVADYFGEHLNSSYVTEVIESSNRTLIFTMLYYLMTIIMFYTWVYLWMKLSKNPLIGVGIALFIYKSINYVLTIVITRMEAVWEVITSKSYTEMPQEFRQKLVNAVSLKSLLVDGEARYHYDENSKKIIFFDTMKFLSVNKWIMIKIIFMIVMLLIIVLVAKKRELTKGKLLCFSILDYVLAGHVGVVIYFFAMEHLVPYETMTRTSGMNISVLIGIIAAVIIFLLIHPIKVRKEKERLKSELTEKQTN